jgi:alpha-ketoglutarate-dependent taurine dioxygenase
MFYPESEAIASDHNELQETIREIDSNLNSYGSEYFQLEHWADRLEIRPIKLKEIFSLYRSAGVLEEYVLQTCPKCGELVDEEEQGKYFCDICEADFLKSETLPVTHYKTIKDPSSSVSGISEVYVKEKPAMEYRASNFETSRISPWANINSDEFLYEAAELGDIQIGDILKRVEKFGICQFRQAGLSPEIKNIQWFGKQIGVVCTKQNDFFGDVKVLRPKPDGPLNSGETSGDLGFHVDGTQHESQPGILIFQYVTDAKIGASSIFLDTAKIFHDMPEVDQNRILMTLARRDAGTFAKKGMNYTGPIIWMASASTIGIRIRMDDVLSVHPDCKADFEFLKSKIGSKTYETMFKPREGDIVVFDNWRLLHARDEVLGSRTREHNRMWIQNLHSKYQAKYFLGIRPFSNATLALVEKANRG